MHEVTLRSVRDAKVKGKRVLVRVDFNVPLESTQDGGLIADDARIKAALPTIEFLHAQGAAHIALLTHVGRPKGEVDESLRVAPIEARLRTLTPVPFELRENVRFDPREEKNDPQLAQELAASYDLFVNEGFSVSHRRDTSVVGVAALLPSFAGLRLIEEVARMSEALKPAQPAIAIIGGAKFETKQPLLQKLATLYDRILVGGVLGNDLLKSRGFPVGASLVADAITPTAFASDIKLVAPEDVILAAGNNPPAGGSRSTNTADVRASERIVDIGPQTAAQWSKEIANAKFVLWNGPVGLFEDGFTSGTDTLARALAASSCKALVGGGDTIAAISKHAFDSEKIFLSTGGGAMLQFLAEGTLPGLEVLRK